MDTNGVDGLGLLGDPTRRATFELLARRPTTVGELAQQLPITRSAVSQHPDRYKGRFDHGWDTQREQTLARQQQLGVVPQDAELTRRHDEIPAWEDMDEDLKPVLAREMEVYAGFLEYADHHIGRLIDALADLEVLDDTLV